MPGNSTPKIPHVVPLMFKRCDEGVKEMWLFQELLLEDGAAFSAPPAVLLPSTLFRAF